MIPTKQLNDGTAIPILAIGTGKSEDHKNYVGQDCRASLTQALKLGIRHIDTGERFENEKYVGEVKQDAYLSVKLGNTRLPAKRIEESLALLQTSAVDLYMVHSSKTLLSLLGIPRGWAEMEQVHAAGKAKSIGVASFTYQDLEELLSSCKVKPSVFQTEFHPYVYTANQPLLELCARHEITVSCFGTLVPLYKHVGPVDEAVAQIAEQTGLSRAQVLMKWALQVSKGIVVMRSGKEEHMKEAVEAVTGPPLAEEQIAAITEAGRGHHFRRYQKHMDG
ncbi:hypothetical protein ASPZODRAFT_28199 [Penicilliopsis zonata CBS 506.65]|uniref:NADP-dependent oxidoreductase domain-containing protein n=1 Tax=Penicilliopsis zonata CBS 506.65 TaxID=1073090 RepID=A0A1L9S8P9_9EURO|nr:hypothetical protein ASPZODRAFT_28199 [Penicilliopsis zonata CBS 506.65]OJJ43530.1 hypothetical protein ASPZODRAFT_28199 [Penicilliopsis zonata CBS 506.65]